VLFLLDEDGRKVQLQKPESSSRTNSST